MFSPELRDGRCAAAFGVRRAAAALVRGLIFLPANRGVPLLRRSVRSLERVLQKTSWR